MKTKAGRVAVRAVDLSLAATAAVAGACVLLARRRRRSAPVRRRLLVIASMYSLDVLRARQAEHILTYRDLDGYFDHVWSVHPFVGADPRQPSYAVLGSPTTTPLSERHTIIEGRTGRFERLAPLPYLNFALAQVELVLLLDRLVAREGIAILCGDPYYHGLLALLLGGLNRRPVEVRVIANHDAIYEAVGALAFPRLFRWRAVEKRVARYTLSRADSVLAGSADNREFALRNGARRERMAYIGNWSMINPIHMQEPGERDTLEDEFGLDDRPVVVCLSRLERMKHPEDVIVSVAKARRHDPRIAAVMVGDGAMREELATLCVELGVAPHVVFAGDRDQRWVAKMLTQATVIAACHSGLALVESALSGTPVVAYDFEWHAELIRPEQEGVLVAYRDTDAMAAAICALVADEERALRLGTAARARAVDIMQPAKLLAYERALADRLVALASRPRPRKAGDAERGGSEVTPQGRAADAP